MRVSGLTKTGDWTFGRGKANYKVRSEAVRQNLTTRIKSFTNDYFADVNNGSPWFELFGTLGNKDSILREIERIVLQTYGVRSIDKLELVQITKRNATIRLSYTDLFDESFTATVPII